MGQTAEHRMTYQVRLMIDRIPAEPFWFCQK